MLRRTNDFFPAVAASTPSIPLESFSGKYALMIAVAADSDLDEAGADSLQAAIKAIPGVHDAFVLITSSRIPTDRISAGQELRLRIEGGFTIEEIP